MPPARAPSRFSTNKHLVYPDDNSDKEVWIQARGLSYIGYGDRHVLIYFYNSGGPGGSDEATFQQIIQLTGQARNYSFYSPVVKEQSQHSKLSNMSISLGTMTRAQRDQMVVLAGELDFNYKSEVNGCRVWTRMLLDAMVKAGLITQEKFAEIDKAVPLVSRIPSPETV